MSQVKWSDPNETVNPWKFPTVAAVGPKGQIAIRHFDPQRLGAIGDVPIDSIQGTPMVAPNYRAAGWVFYEELCNGSVDGVEADPRAWTHWQNLIAKRAQGKDVDPKIIHWHPEIARRENSVGKPHALSLEELEELFPGEVTSPVDLDKPLKPGPKGTK
jgi:hypothetical protein